jgi:hypothetical protein
MLLVMTVERCWLWGDYLGDHLGATALVDRTLGRGRVDVALHDIARIVGHAG